MLRSKALIVLQHITDSRHDCACHILYRCATTGTKEIFYNMYTIDGTLKKEQGFLTDS